MWIGPFFEMTSLEAQQRCLSYRAIHVETVSHNYFVLVFPNGPFRTKNSTAPESVVFCYRRSCLLSVPFSCLFFSRITSISEHSPYRFATAVANLLPVLNLLSVLFLVREGPLGCRVSHNYRAICCKNGVSHRCACVKLRAKGYRTCLEDC